jgi:hypothetical protein
MGRKGIEWTAAMIEKMLEEYAVTFDRVLADDLHVSVNSVRRKAKKLQLSKQYKGRKNMVARKIVTENYHDMSYRQLARLARIDIRSVVNIVMEYGLSRTEWEVSFMKSKGQKAFIRSERARATFGLPQKSGRKVSTNRRLILMRHRLAKDGYIVIKGSRTVYYSEEMKRHYVREMNAMGMGISFELWNAPLYVWDRNEKVH